MKFSRAFAVASSFVLISACGGGGGDGDTAPASGTGFTSAVDTLVTVVVRESDPGSDDLSLSSVRLSKKLPIQLGGVHASRDSCSGGAAAGTNTLVGSATFSALELGPSLTVSSAGGVVGSLVLTGDDDKEAAYEGGVFVQPGVAYSVHLGDGMPDALLRSAGNFDVVWPDVTGGEAVVRWDTDTDYDETMLLLAYTLWAEGQQLPIIKLCALQNDGETTLELTAVRDGDTYAITEKSSEFEPYQYAR